MALWTLFGLKRGKATTPWPAPGQADDGQDGVLGMPRYHPELCVEGCEACAEACPTGAITVREGGRNGEGMLAVDYGRCVVCQLCTEACPSGAMAPSGDWAFGVSQREDLVWAQRADALPAVTERPGFTRSLHIRHVDAGSCNGCESELQALSNPFYSLHRLGIFHFSQIAAWTPEEAEWVGSYLAFPGRIEREGWIGQAKAVLSGTPPQELHPPRRK